MGASDIGCIDVLALARPTCIHKVAALSFGDVKVRSVKYQLVINQGLIERWLLAVVALYAAVTAGAVVRTEGITFLPIRISALSRGKQFPDDMVL